MKLVTSMAVIGAVLAGLTVMAADQPKPRPDRRAEMREKLGLSEQQQTQIRDLQMEFRKQQIEARAKIKVMRLELRQLMSADKLEDTAIRAKGKAIADAEAAQGLARVEHRLALAKILTPEQRRAWKDNMRDGHRRHPMMRDRRDRRGGPAMRGRDGRDGLQPEGMAPDASND
jgi:Spy/CpxP family protein refolding chaperone